MLKNKLQDLIAKKPCIVGRICGEMDPETRQAFEDIMRSEVGDKTISDVCKSEGLIISREAIGAHRHCFAEETKDKCKCFPTIQETK